MRVESGRRRAGGRITGWKARATRDPDEVVDPVAAEGGGGGVLAGEGVPEFDGAVLTAGGEQKLSVESRIGFATRLG